jgi:alpha-tubulin suppressor-like RCC1 family protein
MGGVGVKAAVAVRYHSLIITTEGSVYSCGSTHQSAHFCV